MTSAKTATSGSVIGARPGRRAKLRSLVFVLITTGLITSVLPTSSGAVLKTTPTITNLLSSTVLFQKNLLHLSVPADANVTDAAILTDGAGNATTATGTVTYSVYSDQVCSALLGSSAVTVKLGAVPVSAPMSHSPIGTYYWKAAYGGNTKYFPVATPCGAVNSVPVAGAATETTIPPYTNLFANSNISVTAGSQVGLDWVLPWYGPANASPNHTYLVSSTGASGLPNFDSSVSWPAGSTTSWNPTTSQWSASATSMAVTIPANAAPGTTYVVQLVTCNAANGTCSNASGAAIPFASISLNVSNAWTIVPYTQDFSVSRKSAQATGDGLDVTFGPDGSLFTSAEFSNGLAQVKPTATASVHYADPSNSTNRPFATCFASPCAKSASSALGERIVAADGSIWFTEGGWQGLQTRHPVANNHSQIVAFRPGAGLNKFCTYQIPGNDNEVTALATKGTGADLTIFFTETLGDGPVWPGGDTDRVPTLDYFKPSEVGATCTGTATQFFGPELFGSGPTSLLHRIELQPHSTELGADPVPLGPAEIALDPDGLRVWISGFTLSEIISVNTSSGAIVEYPLAKSNTTPTFGAQPWQVVVDADYVYATEYGDSDIVRITKQTGHVDEVPIALTSDTEQAYGLALHGGRLYFTLADDPLILPGPPAFGTTAFGYIDIANWEAQSAACTTANCAPLPLAADAVVYSGLSNFAATAGLINGFRGIAVATDGVVGIADVKQAIRLTPAP